MNENILYLDCSSGISGDMTVAALLDLGADRQVLLDALDSLPLSGYSVEIKDVYKSGIRACDFNVILDAEHENHDHDMEYLHGHEHSEHVHSHEHSDYEHVHSHECSCHDHNNTTQNHDTVVAESGTSSRHHQATVNADAMHSGHGHTHSARNLQDILSIIRAGNLTASAADLAIRIFEILAKAEAKVHGKGINEVHFHEVGAVDSIVDIVAAAVCLDNLYPDQVVVSALTEGCGQIRCQHGLIPVPVPAVTAIAEQEQLVLRLTDIQGELVTPTGAAIAAAIRTLNKLPEQFLVKKSGLGAGKREYETPGMLRAMWLSENTSNSSSTTTAINITPNALLNTKPETQTDAIPETLTNVFPDILTDALSFPFTAPVDSDSILVLETNIDDCTGEALAFTMQRLLEAGALDAFYLPIYMKKNRPAYLLKAICNPEDREVLEAIIFENTTTIGIRRQTMQRTKLSRKIISVQTPWGQADIKCCDYESNVKYFPENDSVSRLAIENGVGFPEMYRLLQNFAYENMKTCN
ncbi:MAG: nickel pincer cofactor biosynthesis protein LarC [Lachnospiraceae bacterium]|nr:nickel pincer cofactor biosynthesis protein LarC [Lachnospiraceae bacterium]